MQREPFAYGNFSPGFVRSLAGRLRGQRVLEVFAGNGLLAARLAAHGVDIRATSLFAGHDGHERGMHHPVEQLDAVAAVGRYGDVSDILLMSWPTVTEAAARAVLEWGSERAVVFVGEIPRPEWGMAGLSGCATDLFHEITDVVEELTRLRSHLDEIEALVAKGGEIGKRLDFLIQELHREANTLGSKSARSSAVSMHWHQLP